MKKCLVTAALPYANGPLHLGHLAGAYLPADIFVRYKRAMGRDVAFICGSDEHGVPITLNAEQRHISPQELVDENYEIIKKSFEDMGIEFSIFSRTSSKTHKESAQDFFRTLYNKGIFEEKITKQFYDKSKDQFLADRYITGTCPKCSYERAYGDQCESCGSTLNASDLINPRSSISGEKPELKETKHWYLPLDQFQEKLEHYILDEHPEWKKNVYGQCKSWLDQGLQARAVTRDLNWGVPVPLEDADGKVLYVWFDAPIGYISMTKEWQKEHWEDYWKNDDCELYHFIGKDNIVFHSIIFPAMLMAYGDGFILPTNVPANEFLNLEGDKLSTSRNYAVWVHEYLEKFPADSLRFYLTSILPELKDSDFSWKQFQHTHNTELADIIGNFINRSFTFVHKYANGAVPKRSELNELDELALHYISEISEKIAFYLERFENKKALETLMDFARFCNKYFNDQEPWKTRINNEASCFTTLNISLHLIQKLAQILNPFIPSTSAKICKMLQLDYETISKHWNRDYALEEGKKIAPPEILFRKIEDAEIEVELERLEKIKNKKTETMETAKIKDEILFDDFSKIDLRIGTIRSAEKIPKTKKLLKLIVDIGTEERQVVSGIAEDYDSQTLIGQQVTLIANLKAVNLRGVESHGMILAVEDDAGKMQLLRSDEPIPNGREVR